MLIAAMIPLAHPFLVLIGAALTGVAVFFRAWEPLAPSLLFVVPGLLGAATHRRQLPGRALRPADEPELAALVRQVAERLGVREPLLIRVIATPDAALVPQKISGVRSFALVLGWPLLRHLSAARLAAVVAHELAHRQHVGSRRTSLLLSVRESLAASLDNRIRPPAVVIERLLRATQSYSWDPEFAADADSARVVGTVAVRRALEQIDALAAAFDLLVDGWTTTLEKENSYPEDLYDALAVALQDPHVTRLLAAIALEEDLLDPYGVASHPRLAQRLAALPTHAGVGLDETRPVALRNVDIIERWCLKELFYPDGDHDGPRPARVLAGAAERFDASAEEARSVLAKATNQDSIPEAIAAAIDAVGDGTWPRLARAIEPRIRSAPARLRAFAARDVLAVCLGRAIAAALLDAGWSRASPWTTSVLIAPDGTAVDVRELLVTALDSGATGQVEALLHAAGAGVVA
jgi:Zn-dependent protease with chaperone function